MAKQIRFVQPQTQLDNWMLTNTQATERQVALAEQWLTDTHRKMEDQVRGWMKDRRKTAKQRAQQLDEDIHQINMAAHDVKTDAERGRYSQASDLFARLGDLNRALVRCSQIVDSLESSEEMVAAAEADPLNYALSFFQRFEPLSDRLPNLVAHLSQYDIHGHEISGPSPL